MDPEALELEQMQKLRAELEPKPASSNFEQLCRVGIVFLGMALDQLITRKARR